VEDALANLSAPPEVQAPAGLAPETAARLQATQDAARQRTFQNLVAQEGLKEQSRRTDIAEERTGIAQQSLTIAMQNAESLADFREIQGEFFEKKVEEAAGLNISDRIKLISEANKLVESGEANTLSEAFSTISNLVGLGGLAPGTGQQLTLGGGPISLEQAQASVAGEPEIEPLRAAAEAVGNIPGVAESASRAILDPLQGALSTAIGQPDVPPVGSLPGRRPGPFRVKPVAGPGPEGEDVRLRRLIQELNSDQFRTQQSPLVPGVARLFTP
jgi:hypothetical protein